MALALNPFVQVLSHVCPVSALAHTMPMIMEVPIVHHDLILARGHFMPEWVPARL